LFGGIPGYTVDLVTTLANAARVGVYGSEALLTYLQQVEVEVFRVVDGEGSRKTLTLELGERPQQ